MHANPGKTFQHSNLIQLTGPSVILAKRVRGGTSRTERSSFSGCQYISMLRTHFSNQFDDNLTGRFSCSVKHQSSAVKIPFKANIDNDVVDITTIRNAYVATGAPAQLTIFYAGSVCVFDHVLYEKAQAIMLLAGNGLSSPSSVLPSPVQKSAVEPSIADSYVANQSDNTKSFFSNQNSPGSMSKLQHGTSGPLYPLQVLVKWNLRKRSVLMYFHPDQSNECITIFERREPAISIGKDTQLQLLINIELPPSDKDV